AADGRAVSGAAVHELLEQRRRLVLPAAETVRRRQDDGGGVPAAGSRRSRTAARHSHSMVPGGLLVTSRTTRFTSGTSLVMRVEIFSSTSYGRRVQSAVIASSLETGRSTMGCP